MRHVLVLVVATACSGPGAATPQARPALHVVACTPAQPQALTPSNVGRSDRSARWSAGRKPSVPQRAAMVSFGMPSTSGMIDGMVVRRTLQAKVSDFKACYQRELAVAPSLTRVAIAWRFGIAQDGRVIFADPTSRALSAVTNTCISRVFRTMTFPRRATGGSITVTNPLVFEAVPVAKPVGPVVDPDADAPPWTPFAIDGGFASDGAATVARAAVAVLRGKTSVLEACFGAKTGSLRVLLAIAGDGDVATIRAGGFGEDAVEHCIETSLADVHVVNPGADATRIVCDVTRGDALPWRVSPTAAYGVIAATRNDLSHGDDRIVIGANEPESLAADKTYLIVAEPDATGAIVTLALTWANEADAAIVALRDGARAPLYLGMGRIAATEGDDIDAAFAMRPALVVGVGTVTACVGRSKQAGKLREVGALAQRLSTRCKSARCSASLLIGVEPDAVVRDLVEVAGAARRAGFERVLIGGEIGCGFPDRDLEPDLPDVLLRTGPRSRP